MEIADGMRQKAIPERSEPTRSRMADSRCQAGWGLGRSIFTNLTALDQAILADLTLRLSRSWLSSVQVLRLTLADALVDSCRVNEYRNADKNT